MTSSSRLEDDPQSWEDFKFIAFRDLLLTFEADNADAIAALDAALAKHKLLYDDVRRDSPAIVLTVGRCNTRTGTRPWSRQ